MESQIRNRAVLMRLIIGIVFIFLCWSFIRIEWKLPALAQKISVQGRGDIISSDGVVLAKSTEGKRVYPQNTLAGQIIGMLGKDRGLEGIEAAYNRELENGETIALTINSQIQAAAELALAKRIPDSGGDYGSVVVLESLTGRILAAASYPPFDPNNWKSYSATDRRNRPFLDVYEPGSIIKAITIATALNDGLVTPNTEFDTPMKRHVGGQWGHMIGDSVEHPEKLDTTGILRYSSNVGISYIVEKMPHLSLRKYMQDFGFGEKIDLGPIPTQTGRLHKERDWTELVNATTGFGQGMDGTTLQMAVAFNVLANDGLYIPPKIIEGAAYGNRKKILSNPSSRQIKPMLQEALNGIHNSAGVSGYACAGKTGTAQMIGEDGKYSKEKFNSTYAGFCQTNDPRITIAIMVHSATKNYHGAQLAAPIFQELSSFVLSMWSITPSEIEQKQVTPINENEKDIAEEIIQ